MVTDTRPYNHNRPIWFLNMCVTGWQLTDAYGYLLLLVAWAPAINEFLDGTMVNGNANAQAVVDVCYRLYLRFGDFLQLMIAETDNEYIKSLHGTFRRLDGLTTRPKPKRKKK